MIKKNVLLFLLIISFIFIIFFSYILFIEYKKNKNINQNIKLSYFLISNLTEVISLDFNSKRIRSSNINNDLIIHDTNFVDTGYLLVSGFDPDIKSAKTNLISLETGTVVHTWIPPINDIHRNSSSFLTEYNLKKNYRMQHPIILENGDLIFTSGEGPLVRIDKCSNYKWSINRHFHHSIEKYDKDHVIVPLISNINISKDFPILNHGFGFVDIKEGKIIREFSVFKILEENNQIGLLYGVGEFEYDRVHLNDAEVIMKSDEYFNKGDVMLSSKHLSTVLVYRPSNNKILWIKTGPWLNQHDIDYLGTGKFSIFGNDTFRYNNNTKYDNFLNKNNKIYIYDYVKDEISTIYDEMMLDIKTPTQGLHKILNNGDVFIEDTDNFRLLRIGVNGKRWEYYNLISQNKIGSIHWSRYLDFNNKFDWLIVNDCKNNYLDKSE